MDSNSFRSRAVRRHHARRVRRNHLALVPRRRDPWNHRPEGIPREIWQAAQDELREHKGSTKPDLRAMTLPHGQRREYIRPHTRYHAHNGRVTTVWVRGYWRRKV